MESVKNSSVLQQLPVISSEIGDTWYNTDMFDKTRMYGVQSDPMKVAQMRAIQRERTKCMKEGKCSLEDQVFRNFTFLFYKVFEHTW